MTTIKEARRFYLPSRAVATTLSLFFAFLYSNELGVLNRSYVAVVMTLSVMIIIFTTSGTTLTLRNLQPKESINENLSSFISLIFIEIILGLLLLYITLFIFSTFKLPLPTTIIFIALIYFFFSAAHLIFMEMLIAYQRFKIVGIFEVLTILLQLIIYFFFKFFSDTSIAGRLFLAFSASYLIVTFCCYIELRSEFTRTKKLGDPRIIFKQSKGNHSIGTVLGLVDRLDRLIIAWFLPFVLVAKFAVMSGLISFFRFLPDALSKILVSTKSEAWRKYLKNRFFIFFGLISFIGIAVFSSQILIIQILGPEWLLPWGVAFIFALQELARGSFQLSGNYKVSVGVSTQTHKAALMLLVSTGPLAIILANWIGIIGVPLGFLTSYLGVLLYMKRKTQSG